MIGSAEDKLAEAEDKIASLMEVIAYEHELEYETKWEANGYACRLLLPVMEERLMLYTETSTPPWKNKDLENQIKKGFLVTAVEHIHKRVKMRKLLLKKFERVT